MAFLPNRLKFDPPYLAVFDGLLCFRRFIDAEGTILRLETLRGQYLAAGDQKGLEYCRDLALLGRRRAESISRNPRIAQNKRRQKAEMAQWFRIWLETPELFEAWLSLRKQTAEFEQLQELDPAGG